MAFTSPIILWKEQKQDMRLYGRRCRKCGALEYPMRRVCLKCGAKDDLEDVKMSRKGKVYTFTIERAFPSADPPLIMVVADLEAGGRVYLQLTDCGPKDVKIGMPVELTFRRIHQSKGINNYYWKCRPAKE